MVLIKLIAISWLQIYVMFENNQTILIIFFRICCKFRKRIGNSGKY